MRPVLVLVLAMAKAKSLGGSEEEVAKIFSKFDKNGDGKISSSELRDILIALGSETSPDEVSRIMSELDKDGDGFIDMAEFAAFQSGGDAADKKDLRDAFDLYDRDKNGVISALELHFVLRSIGEKCSLKDCKKMIKSVDKDGDGCVNFEEFNVMMTKPPAAKPN